MSDVIVAEHRRDAIDRLDGFLPLEDYGLIGDGTTAALVGRDGSIDWMCVPRFDSPPVFAALLDRGAGRFQIAPRAVVESRQYYLPDTSVLVTELAGDGGRATIEDALALRPGAELQDDAPAGVGELVRRVRARGRVQLHVALELPGGAAVAPRASGLHFRCRRRHDLELQLWASVPLEQVPAVLELGDGDVVDFVLRWNGEAHRHRPAEFDSVWTDTVAAWRAWAALLDYEGPCRETVRRCAFGLKMLDHFENGAIVAAPTTSLPERIGGGRNWDYRYAWVRDAALSTYAMRRIGLEREAAGFIGWVLDALERSERALVVYDLDGRPPPDERELASFEGYRRSRPVRFGNAAAHQIQHDVYGEIIDCAFQGAHERPIDPEIWTRMVRLAEAAARRWHRPDRGIWEVRSGDRCFTYSAALCHVALDRMARLATRYGHPGDVARWRETSEHIQATILERAWSPERRALCGTFHDATLDASVLSLPLRRVIPVDHPRMTASVDAIERDLGAGHGLVYRYCPDELVDGVGGGEGAFLLCSFWLVEVLALQGRVDKAVALFESLCARAGTLGLLPEQVDPGSGAFLGNYPQALSQVGAISAGVRLWRILSGQRGHVRG